jgi:ferric-dicitrate binding protein FerR (iron transport regulator)
VKVGPSSKLRIAPKLAKDVAAYSLDGTGVFEVAPGLPRQFVVRARNTSVVATGTAFAIRAFPDEPEVMVRVTAGEVTVSSPKDSRTVAANQTVAVDTAGAIRDPAEKEANDALSWTSGRFVYTGHTLGDFVPELKRWFGTVVEVKDQTLLARPVALDVPLDSPRQAIEAVEKSANVKAVFEGQKMIFQDASAAASKPAPASKKKKK